MTTEAARNEIFVSSLEVPPSPVHNNLQSDEVSLSEEEISADEEVVQKSVSSNEEREEPPATQPDEDDEYWKKYIIADHTPSPPPLCQEKESTSSGDEKSTKRKADDVEIPLALPLAGKEEAPKRLKKASIEFPTLLHNRCQWIDKYLMIGAAPFNFREWNTWLSEFEPDTVIRLCHDHENPGCQYWKYEVPIKHEQLAWPINNGQIENDAEVLKLVALLLNLTNAGKRVYMHCVGGVGRAGTIAAIYAGKKYNTPAEEVLKGINADFQKRQERPGKNKFKTCPETEEQKEQVRRLLKQ